MSRPIDLPEYQREPKLLLHYDTELAATHPSVGVHLMAAAAEAQRLGLILGVDGGSGIAVVRVARSADELAKALEAAQKGWDADLARYDKAFDDPASVPAGWQRDSVDRFAADNDFDAVDWTKAGESA